MRLLLGEIPNENDYNGFGFFLKLFFTYGLFYVGLLIGGIIALLFISTDVFLLRKRLDNNSKSALVRIAVLLVISLLVFILHYFLEKAIDII
ncbi:hypothetical protein [Flavobacterium haoranii]|uniref:Uncharacterized protein n=2 Tax=Flavobacterium haoranii TaxID=683124 RepID=A0A1M6HE84_9FLAO|nr:hypothetical protein [Flavobacterium haoranii]SHJ20444.1 hypothetical protein SAMN05444337_1519 [Flavobacterium haoranii]